MPRPLTETQNDMASAMLAAGMPQKDIAAAVGCHIGHVKRIKRNLHYWNTARSPSLCPRGRPRILAVGHMDVCLFGRFVDDRVYMNFSKNSHSRIVRRCKRSSMMNMTLLSVYLQSLVLLEGLKYRERRYVTTHNAICFRIVMLNVASTAGFTAKPTAQG